MSKQKTLTLGRDNGKTATTASTANTMPRSASQASINSNNNNNSPLPGTPISQHSTQNTSIISTARQQQQQTPVKINKHSENESFDDDDDEEEYYTNDNIDSSRINTTPTIANGGNTSSSSSSNYDVMHPRLHKLNLNQTKQFNSINDSQYEHIDSPPLTGNSVTTGIYRENSKDFLNDNEVEQIIGKALVSYEFKGTVQNAISIIENETLDVLEKDSGDGWTLVKRSNNEKGYVPTDYIKIEYF